MKKLILTLAILLGIGFLVLAAGKWALEKVADQALRASLAYAQSGELQLEHTKWKSLHIASWNQITIEKFQTLLRIDTKGRAAVSDQFTIAISKLSLKLISWPERKFMVEGFGFLMKGRTGPQTDAMLKRLDHSFAARHIKIPLRADILTPRKAAKQIFETAHEMLELLRGSEISVPIEVDGLSTFVIKGKPYKAYLKTDQSAWGRYRLVMEKSALRKISWELEEKLTEAELEAYSKSALRAPKLIEIRERAQSASQNEKKKRSDFPEDAYRHLLWSFWLTRSFGAAFAEKITEAHEIGSTTNTEADHIMDRNNNRLGREYAKANYAESALRGLLFSDKRVIHSTKEVNKDEKGTPLNVPSVVVPEHLREAYDALKLEA